MMVVAMLVTMVPDFGVQMVYAADPEILINYNFDDENVNDSSGKGNNGTECGTVTYADHDGGKALVLNGSGWIDLPRSLVYTNQQFTVEISFNPPQPQVRIF